METIIALIIITLFILILEGFRNQNIIATMQRQLEEQRQQIQALKARLKVLEPKDEVDKFIDKMKEM